MPMTVPSGKEMSSSTARIMTSMRAQFLPVSSAAPNIISSSEMAMRPRPSTPNGVTESNVAMADENISDPAPASTWSIPRIVTPVGRRIRAGG